MLRRVSAIVVLIVIAMLFATAVFSAPRKRPSTAHFLEPWPCMQPYKEYERWCMAELYEVGLSHLSRKDYDKAIMRFSQILSLQEFALVYSNRGTTYALKGDYRSARPDLARALDMDPRRPENWYNLARADLELERYDEALDSANVAVDLAPDKADFLDLRAAIHRAMHHPQRAEADTAKALEIRDAEEKKILSDRALRSEKP